MSDLDIHLPGIVAGDPDAFGRWVAGAEPRVRASLATFAAVVDTEAVVQETLLRVWNVAPRFRADGRPDGLVRLAVRIARNLAIDEVRRSRRVQAVEARRLEQAPEPAAPPAPDPMLRRLILRCIEELPARPAAAIRQRIAARGGRSDAALAEAAGMKLNTFLQNVRRARIGLERCLEAGGAALPAGGLA